MRDAAEKLFQAIAKQSDEGPGRNNAFQYYQTLYYKEKMLPVFEERYAREVQRAEELGQPKPRQLTIRQQVVKEFWDREPPEEKTRLKALAKEDFQERHADVSHSAPVTAEEFEL